MNISIFGLGYVGSVSVGCLSKLGHKVVGVDVVSEKVDKINNGKSTIIEPKLDDLISTGFRKNKISATSNVNDAIKKTEISILCIGTPPKEDGELNMDYIFDSVRQISHGIKEKKSFHIILVRSTVFPGTCEIIEKIIEEESNLKKNIDFAVISNPEFLREGSAVADYFEPPYTLIGGSNAKAIEKISTLYNDINGEIIVVERKVAEIIKYVNNSFHALKVGFANEIGNICQLLEIDSHKVMDIFCKDTKLNLSSYYLKPAFSYGGSCLPKDLSALKTFSNKKKLKTHIIDSINISNDNQIDRAVELLIKTGKRSFGFMGVSFKSNTDDLRNSPLISVIEKLIEKKYKILIYDNNVSLSQISGENKNYIEKHLPNFSNLFVQKLGALISESEVLVIGNKNKDFAIALDYLNSKIIFDFVRIKTDIVNENYYGINW